MSSNTFWCRGAKKFIQAVPEVIEINARGCRLALPEASYEITHRRVERQRCRGITVHLIQNSSSFSGSLLEFTSHPSGSSSGRTAQSLEWIDATVPAQVIFHSGSQTFTPANAASSARLPDETRAAMCWSLCETRSSATAKRSSQRTPDPHTFPNIIFRHPLTQKHVDLKVADLSGSGLP